MYPCCCEVFCGICLIGTEIADPTWQISWSAVGSPGCADHPSAGPAVGSTYTADACPTAAVAMTADGAVECKWSGADAQLSATLECQYDDGSIFTITYNYLQTNTGRITLGASGDPVSVTAVLEIHMRRDEDGINVQTATRTYTWNDTVARRSVDCNGGSLVFALADAVIADSGDFNVADFWICQPTGDFTFTT